MKELLDAMDAEDKTLRARFGDAVKAVIEKIKAFFSKLAGKYKSTTSEAKLMTKYTEECVKAWDEVLTAAIEANQRTAEGSGMIAVRRRTMIFVIRLDIQKTKSNRCIHQ